MSNVESAAAAGDSYNLRSVLLADGTGAIVGSALGSPFPPAVYIGHPGWKEAGGRASYSMASGLFVAVLCFLGLFGVLSAVLPMPAIVPILLYIGLLIGAQAFQSTPRLHAAAVVAAIIPNLAAWGAGLIDNALAAAGTSAAELGEEALEGAGLVYHGLHVLGQGATLAGIVLGAIVTFILEKQLFRAAIAAAVGAALCWIGLLHAEQVGWAAAPSVALGYVMLAAVLAGIGAPATPPARHRAGRRSRRRSPPRPDVRAWKRYARGAPQARHARSPETRVADSGVRSGSGYASARAQQPADRARGHRGGPRASSRPSWRRRRRTRRRAGTSRAWCASTC